MRRIYNVCFLSLLLGLLGAAIGCSGDSGQSDTAPADKPEFAVKAEPVTLKDTIEYVLNEAVDRVRYGDKSGLYENEFEYMRKTVTFDDYLTRRYVAYAKSDTVSFLEVLDLNMYDHDSADVILNVHFENAAGDKSVLLDTLVVFYHNGRWIKPTESNMKAQLEWEAETGRSSGNK